MTKTTKTTKATKKTAMTNWSLARRDLLKSLGAGAACLPLLRAESAWAQAAGARKHFMVLQMSEGLRQGAWKPGTGALGTLPKSCAPFEPHKADMIFIPGLNNPGGGGGHGSYGCAYYGLGGTGGGQYKEPTGKTVDQVVAGGLEKTAMGRPSMNLHVQLERAPRSTTMPGGSKCFWTGQGQPINPIGDPYAVYKDIFGSLPDAPAAPAANAADVKKLMLQKKSILDYLGTSLEQFKARVGKEDKEAIEGHLTSIRELEMQLSAAPVDAGKCGGAPAGMIDLNVDASYPLIMKAHLGLMLAALKCGVTNVVTLQTGDSSGNNINFGAFVEGLPARSKNNYKSPFRNWHDLGHNPVMDGTDHKQMVDQWFFARWAELFATMKSTPDGGGGTLWDNTLIVIGNHVEDGGNHNSNAIPWMLAGRGGAPYLNYGQCVSGSGSGVKAVMAGVAESLGVKTHPYGAVLGGLKKG
jgi:hypothetical protein